MKVILNKVVKYSLLTLLIILISSCSRTKKFMHSIPGDTNEMFAIKINSITDKLGINKKKNTEFKYQILEALKKDLSANDYSQIEKVFNDLSASGIDTKTPIYFFNTPSLPYLTVAGNVRSQKKLKKLLMILENYGLSEPLTQEEPYNYTVIANNIFVIFNKKTIISIYAAKNKIEAAKKQAISLFTLPKEESLVKAQPNLFNQFRKKKEDFIFYYALENTPKKYKQQLEKNLISKIDLSDINLLGSLNFEKGKTNLTLQVNSKNKNLFLTNKKITKKLKGKLLNSFPANTIALFSIGLDGKTIYKELLKQANVSQDFIQNEDVKEFITSIDGDCSIGAFTMGVEKVNPKFLALVQSNTKKIKLDSILGHKDFTRTIKNKGVVKLKENEFLLRKVQLTSPLSQYLSDDIFIGVKKNYLYITNNELIYKDLDNKIEKTMKSSSLTSNLKGKRFFATFNFEKILDLSFIKLLALLGNNDTKEKIEKASLFTHLEVINEKNSNNIEFVLYQKDSKQTILELFLSDLIKSLPLVQ